MFKYISRIEPVWKRIVAIILVIFAAIVVLTLVVIYSLYLAANVKPTFYKTQLQIKKDVNLQNFRSSVTKTNKTFEKVTPYKPNWEVNYTEDEINGFFAEGLKNNGKLLPPEVKNPRVSIENDDIQFACTLETGSVSGVLHLTLDASFPEPNVIKVRFKNAKLGLVSFSTKRVRDLLADGMEKSGTLIEKTEEDGFPTFTALLEFNYNEQFDLEIEDVIFENKSLNAAGRINRK
ncbi:MAG: hypothetical protein ACRC2T_03200 [Thermoguttaceae bacterium]